MQLSFAGFASWNRKAYPTPPLPLPPNPMRAAEVALHFIKGIKYRSNRGNSHELCTFLVASYAVTA